MRIQQKKIRNYITQIGQTSLIIPIEYLPLVVYNLEKKLFIKFNEPSALFKDPYKSKYQLLIKKVGLKYFKNPKTFIEF